MPKINHILIIEPPPVANTASATFEAALEWVKERGVDVERQHQFAASPDQGRDHLIENPLPLVVVDGRLALSGRYPTREEMGVWMMFGLVSADSGNAGGLRCCTL